MIRYALRCTGEHAFESWFQSSEAFERLSQAGHLSCPTCGTAEVSKALMAPAVAAPRAPLAAPSVQAGPVPSGAVPAGPVPAALAGAPAGPQALREALAELRRKVEETSDYVGDRFAAEARAIHDGLSPERPIWGEARPDEARRLVEDGIPVAPLPFIPRSKTN